MCVHRTDNGQCKKYSDNTFTSYCVDGPCPDDTPTNADRIRGMSDEELAEFIKHLDSGLDEICDIQDISQDGNGCDRHENCYACYLDWLKQPAKEEHHEAD